MAGALELLETLRGKKTLALASSSYRDAVDGVLQGLDIADYFQAIVSGLDVARVKPAPCRHSVWCWKMRKKANSRPVKPE